MSIIIIVCFIVVIWAAVYLQGKEEDGAGGWPPLKREAYVKYSADRSSKISRKRKSVNPIGQEKLIGEYKVLITYDKKEE